MTCNRCGRPCQGGLCRECERDERWADEFEATVENGDLDDDEDEPGSPASIETDGGLDQGGLELGGTTLTMPEVRELPAADRQLALALDRARRGHVNSTVFYLRGALDRAARGDVGRGPGRCPCCGARIEEPALTSDSHPDGPNHIVCEGCTVADGAADEASTRDVGDTEVPFSVWCKRVLDAYGPQNDALCEHVGSKEALVDILVDVEQDLTDYEGIGAGTAGSAWNWYYNVYVPRQRDAADHDGIETDGGEDLVEPSEWSYDAVVYGNSAVPDCRAVTGNGDPCPNNGHGTDDLCGNHKCANDPETMDRAHRIERFGTHRGSTTTIVVCVDCEAVWEGGHPATNLACPSCDADAGERCLKKGGSVYDGDRVTPHPARRVRAYAEIEWFEECPESPGTNVDGGQATLTDGGRAQPVVTDLPPTRGPQKGDISAEDNWMPTPRGRIRAYFNDELMAHGVSARFYQWFESGDWDQPQSLTVDVPFPRFPHEAAPEIEVWFEFPKQEIEVVEPPESTTDERVFVPAGHEPFDFELRFVLEEYDGDTVDRGDGPETDGGEDRSPLDVLVSDQPPETVQFGETEMDSTEFVETLRELAGAAEAVATLASDLRSLQRTGLRDDDVVDLLWGRTSLNKSTIRAVVDGIEKARSAEESARKQTDFLVRLVADLSGEGIANTQNVFSELQRLHDRYGDELSESPVDRGDGPETDGGSDMVLYLTTLRCSECDGETTFAHDGPARGLDHDATWPDVSHCPECGAWYPDDLAVETVDVHEAERVRPEARGEPVTDGGLWSDRERAAQDAAAAARDADDPPDAVLKGTPVGRCLDCEETFTYGTGTPRRNLSPCPGCGGQRWGKHGYQVDGELVPVSELEDDVDRGDGVETDGGEERVVRNPDDAEEVSKHHDHDGFSVFRFGAGDLVDIHISCEECSVRYIIEDVPKDKAENPGKYLDDEDDATADQTESDRDGTLRPDGGFVSDLAAREREAAIERCLREHLATDARKRGVEFDDDDREITRETVTEVVDVDLAGLVDALVELTADDQQLIELAEATHAAGIAADVSDAANGPRCAEESMPAKVDAVASRASTYATMALRLHVDGLIESHLPVAEAFVAGDVTMAEARAKLREGADDPGQRVLTDGGQTSCGRRSCDIRGTVSWSDRGRTKVRCPKHALADGVDGIGDVTAAKIMAVVPNLDHLVERVEGADGSHVPVARLTDADGIGPNRAATLAKSIDESPVASAVRSSASTDGGEP